MFDLNTPHIPIINLNYIRMGGLDLIISPCLDCYEMKERWWFDCIVLHRIYDQIARKSIPKKSMISSCIYMLSAKNYTFFFIQTGRSENLWRKVKEFDSFLHATLTRLWMACKLQEALFTSTHHFYFTTYIFSIFIWTKGGVAGPDAPKMQALPKLGWPPPHPLI